MGPIVVNVDRPKQHSNNIDDIADDTGSLKIIEESDIHDLIEHDNLDLDFEIDDGGDVPDLAENINSDVSNFHINDSVNAAELGDDDDTSHFQIDLQNEKEDNPNLPETVYSKSSSNENSNDSEDFSGRPYTSTFAEELDKNDYEPGVKLTSSAFRSRRRFSKKLHKLYNKADSTPCNKPTCNIYCICKTKNADPKFETQGRPYECELCYKRFRTKRVLLVHYVIHTGEKPFKCRVCKKPFARKADVKKHEESHFKIKRHICGVCYKRFTQSSSLRQHEILHMQTKPYVCDTCYRPFAQKRYLKKHMLIHSDEKGFHCEICGHGFTHKQELTFHMYKHTKAPYPFQCKTCLRRFLRKTDMNRHAERVHGTLYNCRECGLQFAHRKDVDVHSETHHPSKSHECFVCESQFTCRSELEDHLKVHQEGQFVCTVCYMTLASESEFDAHLQTHSGDLFLCTLCDAYVASDTDLQRHLQMHIDEGHLQIDDTADDGEQFMCEHCGCYFLTEFEMQLHATSHESGQFVYSLNDLSSLDENVSPEITEELLDSAEKKYAPITVETYECDICDCTFVSEASLLKHQLIHTLKDSVCSICCKQFPTFESLQKHLEMHSNEIS